MNFKIGGLIETVMVRDHAVLVHRQQALDLMQRPDVKLAFVSFGIGIERREISACQLSASRWRVLLHFPHDPRSRFFSSILKQRFLCGIFRNQPRIGQQSQQRAIVVKHFFEMGNRPVGIDRVARKAAAELIKNTALAHALERETRHVSRGIS